MKELLKRSLQGLGVELRRSQGPDEQLNLLFPDLSEKEREIVRAVRPYTMTSLERLVNVVLSVSHVVKNKIPGDIVECGVWRGGCMMAAALTLRHLGDTTRHLHLYDTFEGMSQPGEKDLGINGEKAAETYQKLKDESSGWCLATQDDVRANLLTTGYPQELVHLVPGKVEQSIPGHLPGRIALLRLDTDWYESTRHELLHLYPLLNQWGIMIIDDYGHWEGAKKAVDEFLATLPHPVYLHRVDYTGRMMVKTEA